MDFQVDAKEVMGTLGSKIGQLEIDKAMLEAQVMQMAKKQFELETALEAANSQIEGGK